MKLLDWHNWGIKTRMYFITALPVVLVIGFVIWLHFSRLDQIEQDLHERGNLITATMAESSQYGVISGNVTYLDRMLMGLVQADPSIYKIKILDANRNILVEAVAGPSPIDETRVFEAEIRKALLDVNTFGVNDTPHVSDSSDPQSNALPGAVVGYVRVIMSPTSMLAKKRNRTLIGTAAAAAFLVLSGLIGFILARGISGPLAATIGAVRQIRGGKYDTGLKISAGGEIGELQDSIIKMSESLDHFTQDLEGKVLERTRALAEARDAALKADAEKRRLIQKVTSVAEEERQNIAVDIHDHLNASVIVVRLELQRILEMTSRIEGQMRSEFEANPDELRAMHQLKKHAESSLKLMTGLYAKARDIVKRLRPEVIDTLGLRDAVEEMVRQYDELHPNCRFDFRADGNFTGMRNEVAISSYRLIQEALSNVVKHAEATIAKVRLEVCESQDTLTIYVSDNGRGFNPLTIEPGIGLIGMRERVFGLNGKLEINSQPNAGTTLHIELPLTA